MHTMGLTMKKRTLLLLTSALALVLSSCGASDPKAFADRFTAAESKAWQTGDLHDLEAAEDPGIVFHLPGDINLTGWKAHADYITTSRPKVSNLHQEWKYITGEGNHIVLSYKSSATMDGNNVTNDDLFVLRLNNGRVAEIWANGAMTTAPAK